MTTISLQIVIGTFLDLTRYGYVTEEEETGYLKVLKRIHFQCTRAT